MVDWPVSPATVDPPAELNRHLAEICAGVWMCEQLYLLKIYIYFE